MEAAAQDDGWVFEQKVDGKRAFMEVFGDRSVLLGRNGPLTVVDGPWCALGRGGNLNNTLDGELLGAVYWVFDVVSPLSWKLRHSLLVSLLRDSDSHNVRILPTYRGTEQKRHLLELVRRDGLEGVVAKRYEGGYPKGRTLSWRKAKLYGTGSAVVMVVGVDGKENVLLGAVTGDPIKIVPVCHAATRGQTYRVGDVVQVRYLYMSNGNRLVQPVLLGVSDVSWEDCGLDQFRRVNKDVNDD
jgi:hypothetical protein